VKKAKGLLEEDGQDDEGSYQLYRTGDGHVMSSLLCATGE
jgi:hypothetical protein